VIKSVPMTNPETNQEPSKLFNASTPYLLTLIRIVIGWHFLYEGITKLVNNSWSSGAYLLESRWWLSGIFKAIATNDFLLQFVDFLNVWGLILIGSALFSGLFTKLAAWSGAGLLMLYYLAYPPFTGFMEGSNMEGSYIWVNKNLIEMVVLIFLGSIPNQWMFGIDNLLQFRKKEKKKQSPAQKSVSIPETVNPLSPGDNRLDRRMVIRNLMTLPVMGGFAYAVLKHINYKNSEILNDKLQQRSDAISSASTMFRTYAGLKELKEQVPKGKIGNLEVSRLISGGNLLSGIAHSRDLIYVNGLMKKYFTTEKVWETFRLCEACGINSALIRTDTNTVKLIHKYWKLGGKLQWLAQTKSYPKDEDVTINARIAMDNGASAIYIQGDNADEWVNEGRFDLFDKWFSEFYGKGFPIGVGAHELDVIEAMEARGYPVDFYMKTIHDNKYWSYQSDEPKIRTIKNNNDNYWCRDPEKTAEFMRTVNKPWIGFKIMAAGAIKPEEGFKYAFEHGVDFACVGMFDYQVVEDCNILTNTLRSITERQRKFSC
jgi:uncharacterized membrane protein YphA (DoxX/SURF4 family)